MHKTRRKTEGGWNYTDKVENKRVKEETEEEGGREKKVEETEGKSETREEGRGGGL